MGKKTERRAARAMAEKRQKEHEKKDKKAAENLRKATIRNQQRGNRA